MSGAKVIVVTGAGSGMGRAAATRWARSGHRVAAIDLSARALKELEVAVPEIFPFECDVTDEEAVRHTFGEVRDRLGDIDRLVTAAGIYLAGRIGELAPAAFRQTMEVNYFGTMHWVDAVIPSMRARRSGEIVIFSSIAGFLPGPGNDAYVASKFALRGYAEVLHHQAAVNGIRVMCICPPPVDTPMLVDIEAAATLRPLAQKLVRPMTSDQIVDAIDKALPGRKFLLLPDAAAKGSYAARRLAPNLTSRILARYFS
jgi:NAD(P)-dependent dehydrogenase (short-subunit alcohol dehydrogenase family)